MSQRACRYLAEAPPLHGVFEIVDVPELPFAGDLVDSLTRAVEVAEEKSGKVRILPRPQPPAKPAERDFVKFVVIDDGITMRCSDIDCPYPARMIGQTRDGEVLPYCKNGALVEFALWMAGV